MTTITLTEEIRKEIKDSINYYNGRLNYELNFSEDLRKNDKIDLYKKEIIRLESALIKGVI